MKWEQAADNDLIVCIVDGATGIYVPYRFCNGFDGWRGYDQESWDVCASGIDDNGEYWESWIDILDNAFYMGSDGYKWYLYQDGDLFAIRDDVELGDV